MQRIRQILLFLKRGYSQREIAKQVKISRPTVHLYAAQFKATGKGYDELLSLKDPELSSAFNETKPAKTEPEDSRTAHFLDQLSYFISELKRVGVTRYLLWQEYLELYAGGFQYSRFCELLDIELAAGWKVTHQICKMLIFAQHDLTKNPPYCDVELINCRNLLIYLIIPSEED